MQHFTFIHDFVDQTDPQGRTYKQINTSKSHDIPIGTLIELVSGVRLFVVFHGRDCDMTPLYYLCHRQTDTEQKESGFRNPEWLGGFPQGTLTIVDC